MIYNKRKIAKYFERKSLTLIKVNHINDLMARNIVLAISNMLRLVSIRQSQKLYLNSLLKISMKLTRRIL